MEYTLLEKTGVRISKVTFGSAALGVAPQEKEGTDMIHRALDVGINFFDTSGSYGNQPRFDRPGVPPAAKRHSAEEILGNALKGRRNDVLIASKVMEPVAPWGVNDRGLSRVHIMERVEHSLKRLQTEQIDIYYAHHPDPNTPIDQTLRAFDDLVHQGKIRYYALSTFPAWGLTEVVLTARNLGLNEPVLLQVAYSLAMRAVEREVVPAARRYGLQMAIYSPLHGGLLAGVASIERSITGSQRWRAGEGPGWGPEEIETAKRIEAVGKEWGYPPAQLALAWLHSRPQVATTIIGPETMSEMDQNLGALEIELTPDQMEVLNEIGINVPLPGNRR